jgi:hypothetical protein
MADESSAQGLAQRPKAKAVDTVHKPKNSQKVSQNQRETMEKAQKSDAKSLRLILNLAVKPL